MKVLLILALAIYATSAALTKDQVDAKWANFKTSYAKSYVNPREEAFRKQIFQNNVQRFEEHNAKFEQGLVTYTLGINQFTDMTKEEMKPYTHGLVQPKVEPKPLYEIRTRKDLGIAEDLKIPDFWDWRDQGIVTPVKNQGACGSCWAFSSNGAIEALERITYGSNLEISVSEQQLVDCVSTNLGCGGGWMTNAFDYIAQNGGLDSEAAYPYEEADGACRYRSDQVAARLSGYVYLTGPDENMLADMVYSKGPVSVAFDADGDFGAYNGGVYYNPTCDPNKFTHAVLIVGYGNENGQDYWLVKNSWGDWWGLDGYIKMARNANNNCGIASKASVPVLA